MGDISEAAMVCIDTKESLRTRIAAARAFLEIKRNLEGYEKEIKRSTSIRIQVFVEEETLVDSYVTLLDLVKHMDVLARRGAF